MLRTMDRDRKGPRVQATTALQEVVEKIITVAFDKSPFSRVIPIFVNRSVATWMAEGMFGSDYRYVFLHADDPVNFKTGGTPVNRLR